MLAFPPPPPTIPPFLRTVGGGAGPKKKRRVFEDHKPLSEVTAGIKAGRYHQGTLRVSRFNPWEGYIACQSVEQEILLSGRGALNRAMDGDVVAGEVALWGGVSYPSSLPMGPVSACSACLAGWPCSSSMRLEAAA